MGTTETNSINASTTGIVGNTGTGFTGTAVTQYNLLVGGANSYTVSNLAPSATAGTVLQSQGALSNPAYSTAAYPSTAGTAGNILASDGTNYTSTSGFGNAVYGDGSDGSQTFDGTSVVLGITPSSNTYTLARDIFLSSGTINNGVAISTNSYRIFCSGTLTNNGTISYNGKSATSATGATAVTNVNGSISNTQMAAAGGNGTTTTGSGGGTAPSNYSLGGTSGAGGTGASGAGGAAGGKGANLPQYLPVRFYPATVIGQVLQGAGNFAALMGGASGGGGGGDTTNSGGGGGSGAGVVVLASLTIAGTGTIQAKGGNGFSPAAGNTGGGGGGGGGGLLITSRSASGGAISGQTLDVSGGTGGTGKGTGTNGGNGGSGTTVVISI